MLNTGWVWRAGWSLGAWLTGVQSRWLRKHVPARVSCGGSRGPRGTEPSPAGPAWVLAHAGVHSWCWALSGERRRQRRRALLLSAPTPFCTPYCLRNLFSSQLPLGTGRGQQDRETLPPHQESGSGLGICIQRASSQEEGTTKRQTAPPPCLPTIGVPLSREYRPRNAALVGVQLLPWEALHLGARSWLSFRLDFSFSM